jgi:hypothetical protein
MIYAGSKVSEEKLPTDAKLCEIWVKKVRLILFY